jgi:hypothetical protein
MKCSGRQSASQYIFQYHSEEQLLLRGRTREREGKCVPIIEYLIIRLHYAAYLSIRGNTGTLSLIARVRRAVLRCLERQRCGRVHCRLFNLGIENCYRLFDKHLRLPPSRLCSSATSLKYSPFRSWRKGNICMQRMRFWRLHTRSNFAEIVSVKVVQVTKLIRYAKQPESCLRTRTVSQFQSLCGPGSKFLRAHLKLTLAATKFCHQLRCRLFFEHRIAERFRPRRRGDEESCSTAGKNG